MIIDAHAHIFPERIGKKTFFTAEMLLAHMDIAGVERAVLLQGPFYGECNEYVAEAVRKYPERLAAAAYIDPWLPFVEKELETICGMNHFCAVKIECSEATGLFGIYKDATLYDKRIKWIWDVLEKKRLVLTLDLGAVGSRSYQTDAVRMIAEEHPNLKIVIAHLGQPGPLLDSDKDMLNQWKQQIDLALLPNVWFDSASLPAYFHKEGYPYRSAEKYFLYALERIGPGKIMWGTDIPGLLIHSTYKQLIQLADIYMKEYGIQDRLMIIGQNASGIYFNQ